MIRRLYISLIRRLRGLADRMGILRRLERSSRPLARWLRSLFAIYDIDDMITIGDPWWTYPAISQVDGFLEGRTSRRAFEYGSGASTLWLAERCESVDSVEHDAPFAELVRDRMPANVRLHVIEPTRGDAPRVGSARSGYDDADFSDYVAAIDSVGGDFDVIVIDGRARVACLEHASAHLAADGVIVFDNSDRRRYRNGIEGSGLVAKRRWGASPSLPYPSCTSLLAHDRQFLDGQVVDGEH